MVIYWPPGLLSKNNLMSDLSYPLKLDINHTCDLTQFRQDLPILGPQIRVTPDRPKLSIYMNSDFSLLPKAKTCFPITADACFI